MKGPWDIPERLVSTANTGVAHQLGWWFTPWFHLPEIEERPQLLLLPSCRVNCKISSQSSFSRNVCWEDKAKSTLVFRRNENQTKSEVHSGNFTRDFWMCGKPTKATGIWPDFPSVTASKQKDTVKMKKYWQLFLSNELKVYRTQQGAWHNDIAFFEKHGYYKSIKLFFNQIFHTLKHIKPLEKKKSNSNSFFQLQW